MWVKQKRLSAYQCKLSFLLFSSLIKTFCKRNHLLLSSINTLSSQFSEHRKLCYDVQVESEFLVSVSLETKNKKNSHLRNMRNLSFPVWNLPTSSSSAKMVNPVMEENIFHAQHYWRVSNFYITLKICLKIQVQTSLHSTTYDGIMPNLLNANSSICLKM